VTASLAGAIETDLAIEAFRALETKRLQLDLSEHRLAKLLTGRLDLDRYVTETEKIRAQVERRRADCQVRGLLPKDPDPA
jgi:hypothetical protein